VRAVRKLNDDERVPQVDKRPRGLAAQAAKQDHDQQAGDQIEDHCRNLKGRHRFWHEAVDHSKSDLRGGQVGRGHLRVVDEGAARRGEIVKRG